MIRVKLVAESVLWFGLMVLGRILMFVASIVGLLLETLVLPYDLVVEHYNGKDPHMSVIQRYWWSNQIVYNRLTDVPKGLIMWGLDMYTVMKYGHHFVFC